MPIYPTGLKRDKASGVYYLRRRIPSDILTCYPGKKELTWSLQTKDYKTAVERHRREEAKLTSEWDQFRAKLMKAATSFDRINPIQKIDRLTPDVVEAICGRLEISSLHSDEFLRNTQQYDEDDINELKAGYANANVQLKMAVAVGDTGLLLPLLNQFLALYRIELDVPESDMMRFALTYGRTAIRVNEKLLRRFEGEDVPTPRLTDVQATPLLSEVVQAYTAYYEQLNKPEMLKKVNAVLPLLVQMVGNKPIGSLTQTDICTFFDNVQNLPPRWKDYCRIQNVTPKEAAAKRIGQISRGTFDGTYIAAMGPFVDYCRGRWQDRGWPFNITLDGIKYTGQRAEPENGQRAFKPKELKRIFEGPEMEVLANSPSEAYKFWLPHLALFTGARANELCQLNPQCDIRKDTESGIWFLDITSDSEGHEEIKKSVKNRVSRRRVPVHPTLIELGFIDYVAELKSAEETLLFPGFSPSVGRAAPKAGEWFTEFLKQIGLRDETPGARLVGIHAFRYTVSNQGEELGVVNTEAITGHANNVTNLESTQDGMIEGATSTVVRKYRGELSIVRKMEILKKIHYGDLQFFAPVRRASAQQI
ncbi:site-specific integrase [uncultured Deefgea sp.]|uniref:site-specific integrase n=1 Tax=uncultured Deefgea sp. TaxID=1304914 RepID=UPI002599F91A|nr:site-specific integrase [uncultured Deefgea sp.]